MFPSVEASHLSTYLHQIVKMTAINSTHQQNGRICINKTVCTLSFFSKFIVILVKFRILTANTLIWEAKT